MSTCILSCPNSRHSSKKQSSFEVNSKHSSGKQVSVKMHSSEKQISFDINLKHQSEKKIGFNVNLKHLSEKQNSVKIAQTRTFSPSQQLVPLLWQLRRSLFSSVINHEERAARINLRAVLICQNFAPCWSTFLGLLRMPKNAKLQRRWTKCATNGMLLLTQAQD